jgi:2-dehydropantoate 2-reductase
LTASNPPFMTNKFLIFGAGAIGTYLGGSLALHGFPVVFLERPAVAKELKQRGLRLTLANHDYQVADPQIAFSIEEALALGPYHAAIFALKSYDTEPAVQSLASCSAEIPPILCLQNGVDNEAIIAAGLGKEKVIPGTVTSAIGRRASGDIILERFRGIGVAAGHPISASLVSALNTAGLNARLYPDAASMKWSKLLANLLSNATSAILGMTPAQIFANLDLYRIEIEQLREALDVMVAQKIQVIDLPGTPVRALAFAARFLPPAFSRPLLIKAVSGGRGGKMPSFHIDLHSGSRRTEVEYLNGAVARAGEKWKVPTPVNQVLTELLQALSNSEQLQKAFTRNPERLIKEIQERNSRGP